MDRQGLNLVALRAARGRSAARGGWRSDNGSWRRLWRRALRLRAWRGRTTSTQGGEALWGQHRQRGALGVSLSERQPGGIIFAERDGLSPSVHAVVELDTLGWAKIIPTRFSQRIVTR